MSHPPTAPTLGALCLTPAQEDDLRWFFNDADAAMGERSAMGPMVDLLAEGRVVSGRQGTPDMAEARVFAAERASRILAVLKALPSTHAATLRMAYDEGVLPREARARYAALSKGDLTVALVLRVAEREKVSRADLNRWCGNAKDDPSAKVHEAKIRDLRGKAAMALALARVAYKAKDDARRAERRTRTQPTPNPR